MERKIILPKPLFVEQGPRAVLLLHAYSGSSNDVRMLCRYLESSHYTVYTPIFSGHATMNPEDILSKDIDQWKDDALSAVDFLKQQGYQEVAVLGLSMGGIVAMNLLTQELPGVIGGGFFCSPIFPVQTQVPENFAIYSENVLKAAGTDPREVQRRMEGIRIQSVQQLAQIEDFAAQTASKLSEITVPVFAAQAGKDEMIDPHGVFQTVEALTATRFTLHWYPNSGHVLTVGPDHRELEQDVTSYLDSLPWNKEKK